MRPTAQCLAPGFVERSLTEFKRLALVALKFEAIKAPRRAMPLIHFQSSQDLELCKRMSDQDIGGYSTVNFDYHPMTQNDPSHARWHGAISTRLPENDKRIQRSGYAGWRTRDRGSTIFGKLLWDVSMYNYLAIHFKSDGRKYFVNVQTDSIVPTDIHQHLLHPKTPGEWEIVLVKWSEFVRTNHGQVVEPQREMLTQKVRSVGVSLIDRIQGQYDLSISQMWATNATREDEYLSNYKGAIGGLPSWHRRQDHSFSKSSVRKDSDIGKGRVDIR